MERQENGNKVKAALLCVALLAGLPFFVACGGNAEEKEEVQTIQIRVTDKGIEMPSSLPTGAAVFEITNAGSHEHSFGIEGPAGDIKLEKPLKPGETTSLEAMYLDTGTYRVYCPVDAAHGESMQLALNVQPGAPAANNS